MTPSRLRQRARQVAERAEGSTREQRHERAARRRGIAVFDKEDGMSQLVAYLPSVQAAGIHDRVTRIAKRGIDTDDPRSLNERRADVFSALLLTSEVPVIPTSDESPAGAGTERNPGHGADHDAGNAAPLGDRSALVPGQVQAQVLIVLPILTLLGLSDEPPTLNGMSPIPLADAAVLAAHAPTWTRVLTNPMVGMPMTVDTYRPTAGQRAFLASRDTHCRYPGCRIPVIGCDADHTLDWALGGRTEITNLSYLCERHHQLKHTPAWGVTQKGQGVLEWTTPEGRRVTDIPEPTGPQFSKFGMQQLRLRARDIQGVGLDPPEPDAPWF